MVTSPHVCARGRRQPCPRRRGNSHGPKPHRPAKEAELEGHKGPYLYLPRRSLPPLQLHLESGVLLEAAPWVSGPVPVKC